MDTRKRKDVPNKTHNFHNKENSIQFNWLQMISMNETFLRCIDAEIHSIARYCANNSRKGKKKKKTKIAAAAEWIVFRLGMKNICELETNIG